MKKTIEGVGIIKKEYPLLHILMIILTIVVVFQTGCLAVKVFETPPSDISQVDFFIDLLTITLTVAAVLISVLSYSAYKLLAHKLEQKTDQFFEYKNNFIQAKSFSTISYLHFTNYEIGGKNIGYLNQAINMATTAFKKVRMLDMDKHENLELMGDIVNNLGYYLAERGDSSDRELTLKYAEFLEENLALFPERGGDYWLDTIRYIKEKFA